VVVWVGVVLLCVFVAAWCVFAAVVSVPAGSVLAVLLGVSVAAWCGAVVSLLGVLACWS